MSDNLTTSREMGSPVPTWDEDSNVDNLVPPNSLHSTPELPPSPAHRSVQSPKPDPPSILEHLSESGDSVGNFQVVAESPELMKVFSDATDQTGVVVTVLSQQSEDAPGFEGPATFKISPKNTTESSVVSEVNDDALAWVEEMVQAVQQDDHTAKESTHESAFRLEQEPPKDQASLPKIMSASSLGKPASSHGEHKSPHRGDTPSRSPIGPVMTDSGVVMSSLSFGPKIFDAPLGGSSYLLTEEHLERHNNRTVVGQDDMVLLPRVEEHYMPAVAAPRPRTIAPSPPETTFLQKASSVSYAPAAAHAFMPVNGGRHKIYLRMQEEVRSKTSRPSILGHIRSRSQRMMFGAEPSAVVDVLDYTSVDRGNITVSWFDGTSSLELHEHVRRSVIRKLKLEKNTVLEEMRILDESMNPPEEIVLSPFIPDGSHFLLRFSLKDASNEGTATPMSIYSGRAPDSPPPSQSPHHNRRGSFLSGLSTKQLESLRKQLNTLAGDTNGANGQGRSKLTKDKPDGSPRQGRGNDGVSAPQEAVGHENDSDEDDMLLHSGDPIEAHLRQITELLISDRKDRRNTYRKREKRQVVFMLANYFVLFLSLIALSAEIQARAPGWLASLEQQMKDVAVCAADKDALFKCVSNGDFAGLVASVILWLSRSVATRRIFLFGFDTPQKLWTVVYESLVTAFCWGFSYLFIRRGLNPDTRHQFVQRFWKDAVYGSLAGFNAAFMKMVLKNLIPQEAVENVMRERQLKILSWLPSFAH